MDGPHVRELGFRLLSPVFFVAGKGTPQVCVPDLPERPRSRTRAATWKVAVDLPGSLPQPLLFNY